MEATILRQEEVPEGTRCARCGRKNRKIIIAYLDETGQIADAFCDLCVAWGIEVDRDGRKVLSMKIKSREEATRGLRSNRDH